MDDQDNDPVEFQEDVNKASSGQWWKKTAVILAILIGGLGVIAGILQLAKKKAEPEEEHVEPVQSSSFAVGNSYDAFDMEIKQPEPEMMAKPPPKEQAAATAPARVRTVYVEKKPAGIDKSASSTSISKTATVAQVAQPSGGATQPGGTSQSGGMMAQAPSASGTGVAKRRDDLDTRMNRGTHISGNMQTRLDTTYSGMAVCVIDTTLYSANGENVLLKPGDVMIGLYDSGLVEPGVRRIAMKWDEIKAQNGAVEVPMNTPGTDSLGTTGLSARVDNHFWENWNAVIMASFFDVAVNSTTNRADSIGAEVVIGATNATSDLAVEILRTRGSIDPTLYTKHGTPCGTTLAHDLDFEEAYS